MKPKGRDIDKMAKYVMKCTGIGDIFSNVAI